MSPSRLSIKPPTIADRPASTLIGSRRAYTMATIASIPDHWRQFIEEVPPEIASSRFVAFGVVIGGGTEGFDYMCALERRTDVPFSSSWQELHLDQRRYAIFEFPGPVDRIREVFQHIYGSWLPGSGFAIAKSPVVERYGEGFDPATGCGDMEVWIPVETPAN